MVGFPLFLIHLAKFQTQSSFISDLLQHIEHPIIDVHMLLIQNKDVFRYAFREKHRGGGCQIVSIESNPNRIIERNNLSLMVLAPILDKCNIGCRFEPDRKLVIYHSCSIDQYYYYYSYD